MEETERQCGWLCKSCVFASTILLVWLLCQTCVDGIVKTVENDEEQQRKWVAQGYKRPLAYRLQSPTEDQMDSLHGLMRVLEVKNAKEGP